MLPNDAAGFLSLQVFLGKLLKVVLGFAGTPSTRTVMHLIEQNPNIVRNSSSQRCNDAQATPSTYSKFAHDITPTTTCRF